MGHTTLGHGLPTEHNTGALAYRCCTSLMACVHAEYNTGEQKPYCPLQQLYAFLQVFSLQTQHCGIAYAFACVLLCLQYGHAALCVSLCMLVVRRGPVCQAGSPGSHVCVCVCVDAQGSPTQRPIQGRTHQARSLHTAHLRASRQAAPAPPPTHAPAQKSTPQESRYKYFKPPQPPPTPLHQPASTNVVIHRQQTNVSHTAIATKLHGDKRSDVKLWWGASQGLSLASGWWWFATVPRPDVSAHGHVLASVAWPDDGAGEP